MSTGDVSRPRFHLAVPVDDLAAASEFYGQALGCERGRWTDTWIDWNLRGHQLVTHLVVNQPRHKAHNPVDGHDVPVPHFGLILMIPDFHLLADSLTRHGREFVIEPHRRFVGQPGEQWTMFLNDPAGNSLEFKAFADDTQIFAVDLQGEGVAPDLRNALADEAGPAPGAPRPDGRSPQHDGAGQNRDLL